MANQDFKIVVASAEQMDWIIKLAENEGWNPGCKDAIAFQLADPSGFFIGLLNGKPIGCVAAIKYENCGFGGYYIILKEHRGRGYGLKLFHHAVHSGKELKLFGLDAEPAQISSYEKSGFIVYHRTMEYIGIVNKSEIPCDNIVDARTVSFDKLLQYDRRHSPDVRKHFLAAWISVGTDRSLVYLDENNTIQGFGAIRKAIDGYKIGPLYADSFDIAESLIHTLVESFENCKVYWAVPMPNESAIKLVEKLRLEKLSETARMYSRQPLSYDWNMVYGLTCLEIG
ncbi:uncharacterized protein TRIADDRAFT_61617 [Trichoplax adhaerens]|uniref:N-acetyltransferase domain-containing protein n=1 Tax=Trichoplax adhaerens TaxID=10228 RepID=B3SBH3_TRIAD|nr:hypothetical protein TRIADDRAFT_61617 [Trichoplax adhaerens]EDV19956.1 hypothetical protein TRIADDRAFT_61617 [Trichoplax adhaerens]|eukprot:XP_002117546.1 hypothetical protein TRIADDRAFT_61617 [Trichoplax adhaerens]